MMIDITPEVVPQFLNDLCNNIDINKHIIEGSYRSYGSYGITFSKSLNTVCEQSSVVFDTIHDTLADYLVEYYNRGYDDGCSNAVSDLSAHWINYDFINGVLIGTVITGVCVLVNKGYKKYRQCKIDKEQKETW